MRSTRVASFLYAVLADNVGHLQRILAECEQHSLEQGYRFSPTKCEVVAGASTDVGRCRIYGEPLKRSEAFIYLGMTFTVKANAARPTPRPISCVPSACGEPDLPLL
jgi:hypothetical protein